MPTSIALRKLRGAFRHLTRIDKPPTSRCLLPPRTPPCFRPEAMMPTSSQESSVLAQDPPGRAQELPSSPQESPRNTPGTPKDHPRAPRHRSRAPNPSQRTPKDHPGAPRHRSRAPKEPPWTPRTTGRSLLLPSLLTPPSLFPVPASLPPPSSLLSPVPLQTFAIYFWQTNLCTNPWAPYRGPAAPGVSP